VESADLSSVPHEPPPVLTVGPLAWIRQNLFAGWFNSLLTVLSVLLIVSVGRSTLGWALTEARWEVITRNITVLVWGRYPDKEVWRLGLSLGLVVALGLLSWAAWSREAKRLRRWVVTGWLLSFPVIMLLLRGFRLPMPVTIANNLGYYVAAPNLLPAGQGWRAPAAVLMMSLLVGLTWGLHRGRLARGLSGLALLVILGLVARLGLLPGEFVLGGKVPRGVLMLVALAVGLAVGRSTGLGLRGSLKSARPLVIAWMVVSPLLVVLLTSFDVGVEGFRPTTVLPIVQPAIWSGILLTVVLSVVSIVGSFPIGVLLALGRRSDLPVVKVGCTLFIEVVRGVPLITILFMAQVMLPLFLPLQLTIDRVVRAMIGMTLFTAAYLAEVVRGGLQAIPHGQAEAARAVGLNEALVTGLVILPQALRTVLPAIMGQFVSMFKDTSLVAIVGLLDLLAVSQSITAQREFIGLQREVYLFAGAFYLVVSYGMSYASHRLEKRLGVGER
jgi:general L-amino acid transport system permease protein